MEEILANLLVPDNDTIHKATEALQNALKSPEGIPALCNVLSNSQSSQVRQYAAVVLRKRLTKLRNWNKLPQDTKTGLKAGILAVLRTESEKGVKMAVVQLIGAIAKHELPSGNWGELQSLLQSLMTSENAADVQLGMFTMSVLTDVALSVFANQTDHFVFLFTQASSALDDLNTVVGYYTVITMTHVVPLCEQDPNLRLVFSKSIPRILKAIPPLAVADEEKACDVLELFSEILTSAIQLIVPHVGPFLQLCLEIAANKDLGSSIRDKALVLVGACARVKKKLIVKQQLIRPIVEGLFGVMCEPPEDAEDDDQEDDWFADDDEGAPFQTATNVLGGLAIYLPPKQLLENVVRIVSDGLKQENPYIKKACYLALAIVTEGASESIRNKYLTFFLQCVCAGITNTSSIVRNAALFALGQLSEHLQPEISEHAEELMPILFEYLSHLCGRLEKGGTEPPGLYSMFYALEAFCENMEDKLVPYQPMLLERLMHILQPTHSVNVQELTLSAVGSVASAVNKSILPYFPAILEKLKMYLLQQHTEETACLQVQALQTLALLASTLGAEHFAPLTEETMALGLKLLSSSEDPDLKSAVYSLFASLSAVMKEESAKFLPTLVESILLSLKSTDGVVPQYKDDESVFPVYEDLSDPADEEDIDAVSDASSDDPIEFTVENPYMDEKEQACLSLKEFAANAGNSFVPFLESSYKAVIELTSYPHDDVRKTSFETVAQLCASFAKIASPEGAAALKEAIAEVVPKCTEIILKDEEILVVNAAMECLSVLLTEVGPPVIEPPVHLEQILKCIEDVLTSQTECQDREEAGDDEEGDAEQDELLMESAGDVIPALGKAMSPAQFVICLNSLFKHLVAKVMKQCSVSQRSFFIGTLAACMSSAGPELEARQDLSQQLLALFVSLAQDTNYEVRNNAIYGIGELILNAKQALFSQYMDVLVLLSDALGKETHPGVIDNICGALAKMIITNVSLIPMEQVFPVFIGKLPLRQDFEEQLSVVRCFTTLYHLGHSCIKAHISDVIRISCIIVHEKMGSDEVISMAACLLKTTSKDFPQEVTEVVKSLPAEQANTISLLLS